ncbi:hypothetical protein WJX77_008771 [Trebouxia sp. C0004]
MPDVTIHRNPLKVCSEPESLRCRFEVRLRRGSIVGNMFLSLTDTTIARPRTELASMRSAAGLYRTGLDEAISPHRRCLRT